MAKKSIFTYDSELDYHIEALKSGSLTQPEMRKEYSRLRSIAVKRLERLGNSEYSNSDTYRRWKDAFPTLAKIDKESMYPDRALMYHLNDAFRFLSKKRSSITGMREIDRQTVETLQLRGYEFITMKNIRQFGDFMEETRSRRLDLIYTSTRLAEVFGVAVKHSIAPDEIYGHFKDWLKNKEKLEQMPQIQRGKAKTSDDVMKELKKWQKKQAKILRKQKKQRKKT